MSMNKESDLPPSISGDRYPLQNTVSRLNERLGLYLSPQQQKGLATGLIVGLALVGALAAWNVGTAIRRRL